MKISELVKELQKNKRLFGDLNVMFDETSVNPDAENEYSQHDVQVKGAYKVCDSDGGKAHNALVLEGEGQYELTRKYGNTPLKPRKGKK